MNNDRVNAYAAAMLTVARAEGNVEEVSDELFRFARALDVSDELRMTLSDQRIEASRRQQIIEDLLGGKATETTVGLVSMVVGAGRAGELSAIADALVDAAATQKAREVALVRSAVELSDDQQARLAQALTAATGKQIELKVTVDPNVVGGIVTTIGDTVIDGSVRSRIVKLREAF
jgi:F-type H+-transporting ATPase subunit delta